MTVPKHVHAENTNKPVGTPVATLFTEAEIDRYLRENGAEGVTLWDAFATHGLNITRCEDPQCKLARSALKTD